LDSNAYIKLAPQTRPPAAAGAGHRRWPCSRRPCQGPGPVGQAGPAGRGPGRGLRPRPALRFIVKNTYLFTTCICITHTRLKALCPGLPRSAGTRQVKPIWILLEQETVSGSGISRAICKTAPRSRQITMPAPHYSVFLQAGCPSCRPTNSVKALKESCICISV